MKPKDCFGQCILCSTKMRHWLLFSIPPCRPLSVEDKFYSTLVIIKSPVISTLSFLHSMWQWAWNPLKWFSWSVFYHLFRAQGTVCSLLYINEYFSLHLLHQVMVNITSSWPAVCLTAHKKDFKGKKVLPQSKSIFLQYSSSTELVVESLLQFFLPFLYRSFAHFWYPPGMSHGLLTGF